MTIGNEVTIRDGSWAYKVGESKLEYYKRDKFATYTVIATGIELPNSQIRSDTQARVKKLCLLIILF